jgi:coenzyme F420-0:L-glutamate ligase/coenzyme F420-1:gamma-L-glutamate ligase
MPAPDLTLFAIPGLPLVQPGDDLGVMIAEALTREGLRLQDGDLLVIAQKIVSKAEGRAVALGSVEPSERAVSLAAEIDKDPRLVELILRESRQVIRTKPGVIVVEHRLGYVLANAGIDRSNIDSAEESVLLLPSDPDRAASDIRQQLEEQFDLHVGVIIADSVGRAWRLGTTGMALGSSGVVALHNLRGQPDIFGRELEVSEHAVADAAAAAAELIMGEGDEATPVVVVRGLRAGYSEQNASALLRRVDEDLFR